MNYSELAEQAAINLAKAEELKEKLKEVEEVLGAAYRRILDIAGICYKLSPPKEKSVSKAGGEAMSEYGIYPLDTVCIPYTWKFCNLEEAKKAAKDLAAGQSVDVIVFKTLGAYKAEPTWMSTEELEL